MKKVNEIEQKKPLILIKKTIMKFSQDPIKNEKANISQTFQDDTDPTEVTTTIITGIH